jgi:restriction endonuclease Mrr
MLENNLLSVIRASSFHVQMLLVRQILDRLGYKHIQFMGRRERKEKTYLGGHEFTVDDRLGLFNVQTIVKFVGQEVRVRMLDELAGVVRRTGSDYGILISTHGLTNSAEYHLTSHEPIRIRVVTGLEFVRLLIQHKIGVREVQGLEVDEPFFRHLDRMSRQVNRFIEAVK